MTSARIIWVDYNDLLDSRLMKVLDTIYDLVPGLLRENHLLAFKLLPSKHYYFSIEFQSENIRVLSAFFKEAVDTSGLVRLCHARL